MMSDCNDELASCTSLCTQDEKQTTLLSVSVTFKPQENSEIENNSESEISGKSKRKDDDNGHSLLVHEEGPFGNGEGNGSPPSTLESATKDKTGVRTNGEVTKTEFLPGWKGYSNNIYIQPIIVNTSTNHENCNFLKSMGSRKLTAEELRKQLRLRQASEWITKHNQRIQLKGSLKTGVSNVNPRSPENKYISRCSSSTTAISENTSVFQGKNNLYRPQQKHSRQKSKLAKGFVCRHWARDFLSRKYESQTENEPSSLTIRSYVNVHTTQTLWKTTKALQHKKGTNAVKLPENANESIQHSDHEKDHQESRRTSLSSSLSTNGILTKGNPQEDMMDLLFRNISVNAKNSSRDASCTRRNENEDAIRPTESFELKAGKERAKLRNTLKPNQEQKILTPVSLKEFPPIDPQRGSKISPKIETNRKTPTGRPHSVNIYFSLTQH